MDEASKGVCSNQYVDGIDTWLDDFFEASQFRPKGERDRRFFFNNLDASKFRNRTSGAFSDLGGARPSFEVAEENSRLEPLLQEPLLCLLEPDATDARSMVPLLAPEFGSRAFFPAFCV